MARSQRVDHRSCIQFLLQHEVLAGILFRCPIRPRCVMACGLGLAPHNPVRVEGDSCTCRSHIRFHRCGAGLPFSASRSSFRWLLLCGCLLTVGEHLVVLPLHDAGPVDDFSVSLEVIEGTHPALLSLPFFQVFLHELVSQVEP